MSHATTPTRRPWPWALAGALLGVAIVLAVQQASRTGHDETAARAAPGGDAPDSGVAERFAAPLDRQADTGELAIAAAAVPYRTDTFRIELASGDEAGHEIEQKLRVAAGGTIAYRWSVDGIADPEEFYADLHGHAPPAPGFQEASYRQGGGLQDSGGFVAPFDGIHGWLFKNDSAAPAKVTLEVAGFYEPVSATELARIEQQLEALATH